MSSSFRIFDIAGSAMAAQSVRLNTVASNLANADSVATDAASAYKAREPVFKAMLQPGQAGQGGQAGAAVQVLGVVQSDAPIPRRYEPGNPLADDTGYVYGSNVNEVEQMVDMISASRSYQNSVELMNTAKQLAVKTLQLGE